MADECGGYADEGEEVFGLALVAAVEASAVGEPGHGPFDHPAVTFQPCVDSMLLRAMRWRMHLSRCHRRRWL